MSRVALLADVHCGNHKRHGGPAEASLNRRCREALAALRAAVELADAEGCDAGVVLGDLVDYQRPEAQLLAELRGTFEGSRARWHVLLGNHDMTSTQPGDHALGPLRGAAAVWERPEALDLGDLELALLPFRPGVPVAAWLPAELAARWPLASKRSPRALCLHAGLSDARTPPWLRGSVDSVDVDLLARLCAAHGFERAFAGNWHDRRSWELWAPGPPPTRGNVRVELLQLGALVPTGWDNPGVDGYGTVAVWDGASVRVLEVPGPRFVKAAGRLPSEVRAVAEAARGAGHSPYVEVTAAAEHLADAAAVLEALDLPGEVLPEAGDALVAARSAAVAARSAETLEEALGAFVREMPLPPDAGDEGAFRAAVLAASKGYLARGG